MDNKQSGGFDALAAKTLGGELRSMRKKQGIDIDTVAERLKLSIEQIEALEKGEIFPITGYCFCNRFFTFLCPFVEMGRTGICRPSENGCSR